MTRQERALIVERILHKQYPRPPIPLNHHDNFSFLIAVLLSAQCTDERVNTVTPELFKTASTPKAMSKLKREEIYQIIKPCGLGPKKSKAIKNLSKILVNKFNSKVPSNFDDLESLPGVGHKTASVIMSQAFGEPAFPVDTHIHRLKGGIILWKKCCANRKRFKKTFHPRNGMLFICNLYFGEEEFCKARDCFGLKCKICKKLFH